MKRFILIAIAAAGLAFAASPSYAQSSSGGSTNDSYGNSSLDRNAAKAAKAERKAKKAAKKAEKARMKAEAMKEGDAMMSDHSSATDTKMMKDGDAMMKKGDAMMKDHSSATDAKMMKDGDAMMKTGDTMMMKDTPTVMQKSESMKPTNCPSGTTPQDNGTCMLN